MAAIRINKVERLGNNIRVTVQTKPGNFSLTVFNFTLTAPLPPFAFPFLNPLQLFLPPELGAEDFDEVGNNLPNLGSATTASLEFLGAVPGSKRRVRLRLVGPGSQLVGTVVFTVPLNYLPVPLFIPVQLRGTWEQGQTFL